METIKLTIPNMKSSHCMMTVTGVVNSKNGKVKSIAPMELEVELNNGSERQNIIEAIKAAGYKVNS